jgi:hypothetical protein
MSDDWYRANTRVHGRPKGLQYMYKMKDRTWNWKH